MVAGSQTAMDAVAASQTARDVIGFSGLAYDTIAASNLAIGKYAIGYTTENPVDYADMDAVAASQTAMDAVAGSQLAMETVLSADLSRNIFAKSPNLLNSVYATIAGTQNGIWQYGFIEDTTLTSNQGVTISRDGAEAGNVAGGTGVTIQTDGTGDGDGEGVSDFYAMPVDLTNVSTIRLQARSDGGTLDRAYLREEDGTGFDEIMSNVTSSSYSQFTFDVSGKSGVWSLCLGAWTGTSALVEYDEVEWVV